MKWNTRAMQTELNEEGIIIVHPMPDFKGPETLEIAKENLDSLKKEARDKLKGALFHLPPYYVNAEATIYYGKNSPQVPVALVGNTFIKVMVGKFLLSLMTSKRPIKIFNDEESALEWLRKKMKEVDISKSA